MNEGSFLIISKGFKQRWSILATVQAYRSGASEKFKKIMFMKTERNKAKPDRNVVVKFSNKGGNNFWETKTRKLPIDRNLFKNGDG